LNNLNSITSSIPPILQRQNSAPTQQQQQQQQQPINGDFYKPNSNNNAAPKSQPTPSTAGEIHRKYSLPMNTLATQPMIPATTFQQQMMRKQSAPTIQSIAPSQQQFQQQQPHGSPSRARDRNQFDKIPPNQDVQQLPLLKGGFDAHFIYFRLFHSQNAKDFEWDPLDAPFYVLFSPSQQILKQN
jgi:hypothetical protein